MLLPSASSKFQPWLTVTMSTDSATRGSKAQRVGTQQVTRLFDGSMDDDVTAQPACNNLRYRRVVLADHLLAGRLDDGLGGVRERASDNDLTNIKQRAHDEGNRGESFSKALDDLLGARVSVGGRFEHPLGADAAIRGKREERASTRRHTATGRRITTRNHLLSPLTRQCAEAVGRSGIPDKVKCAQLTRAAASAAQQPSVHDESRAETLAGKKRGHIAAHALVTTCIFVTVHFLMTTYIHVTTRTATAITIGATVITGTDAVVVLFQKSGIFSNRGEVGVVFHNNVPRQHVGKTGVHAGPETLVAGGGMAVDVNRGGHAHHAEQDIFGARTNLVKEFRDQRGGGSTPLPGNFLLIPIRPPAFRTRTGNTRITCSRTTTGTRITRTSVATISARPLLGPARHYSGIKHHVTRHSAFAA